MKGIADTGFIVAFGNRGDNHHLWAVDIAKTITEPLLTCEAVLAEAAFHLGSSAMFWLWCKTECCGSHLIAPGTWINFATLLGDTKIASPTWRICVWSA